MAKVARLEHVILIVEEQANIVGRVIVFGLDLLMREESDFGVGISHEGNDFIAHPAGEAAAVALVELHRVWKPAERIPQGANRELYEHVPVRGGIIMDKNALTILPNFQPETDKIALAAIDPPPSDLGLEQDVAGIKITQPHAPGVFTLRQQHPAPVIEIEAQACRTLLRGRA